MPKPVLPLAGRPHIAYVIDWLRGHGVDEVVISCGHLAEAIPEALAGIDPGVRILYAEEAGRPEERPARSGSPRTSCGSASWS